MISVRIYIHPDGSDCVNDHSHWMEALYLCYSYISLINCSIGFNVVIRLYIHLANNCQTLVLTLQTF